MYAGTKFNWIDQSYIIPETATELDVRPLILTGFSADKGTEKMIRIHGTDFYDMYGEKSSLSFARHGQALLQAARVIDAGGELLCKRVVAFDATLSNVIIIANVSSVDVQQTDSEGKLLYVDATTGEATTQHYTGYDEEPSEDVITSESLVANLPLNVTTANIKWSAKSVENCKTFDEVMEGAVALFDDAAGVYPMYVVTDIGRNADCKAVRIRPDYTTSKGLGFMIYSMSDVESTSVKESVNITSDPNRIYMQTSYAVNRSSMKQLDTDIVEGVYEAYISKLSDITAMTVEELTNSDIIFGCNIKGTSLPAITIDPESIDLSSEYGIPLENGSVGTQFGDQNTAHYNSDAYANELVKFFLGEFDDAIFDVDIHKIYAVCDANYPDTVKAAITKLANHREDFFYFRDLGLGLNTYEMIASRVASMDKSKFVGDYMTSYQVIDPTTKKRIEVTMMYDFAPIVVNHFIKGAAIPLAGEINDAILSSAIEGTINYIPRNTLKVNQKDLLDDLKVNYATYYEYGGNLVVESLYTSQEINSQLSYSNNVLAIQEVMRALRTNCPKNRFKFQTGNDFNDYSEACKNILSNFKPYFNTLEFVYEQDSLKAAQKIFYASVKFGFNNWAQSEIFNLYAIDTSSELN